MNIKDYLRQIKKLDVKINNKIKELDELKRKAYSVSAINTDAKVQTSTREQMSGVVAKIVDLENEINKEIDVFVNLKHKIINEIHSLEDAVYIDLLFKRYVEYKNFEQIAYEMNYSFRQILRLHGIGLIKFKDVIQCHIKK